MIPTRKEKNDFSNKINFIECSFHSCFIKYLVGTI